MQRDGSHAPRFSTKALGIDKGQLLFLYSLCCCAAFINLFRAYYILRSSKNCWVRVAGWCLNICNWSTSDESFQYLLGLGYLINLLSRKFNERGGPKRCSRRNQWFQGNMLGFFHFVISNQCSGSTSLLMKIKLLNSAISCPAAKIKSNSLLSVKTCLFLVLTHLRCLIATSSLLIFRPEPKRRFLSVYWKTLFRHLHIHCWSFWKQVQHSVTFFCFFNH